MNISWYDNISKHIQNQYEEFVTTNFNMTVDGKKASRINFADFLSFEISYNAMKFEIENLTEKPKRLPGLSYSLEQFFWIASSQRYCHVSKDQETIQKLVLSNFPIESFRVNNPLFNNVDFNKDFGCSSVSKKLETLLYPRNFPEVSGAKSLKISSTFVLFLIFFAFM
jgi:Peptidase family M13